MRVSYHEGYFVPLPEKHPFPMGKFPALHRILREEGLITPQRVVAPRQVDLHDLLLVHTPEYIHELVSGTLSPKAVRKLGLPWSEALVFRSRVACQGTINAAFMALEDGLAANLAGGTHHAFPGHGEGFCVLNDVAVAIRVLERSKWIRRALVVDLDVHQGNGTAYIFQDDPAVFTFSMHGEKNYPFHKERSDWDVALPDGLDDEGYLSLLSNYLPEAIALAKPDLIFYLAGIDVMAGDRFGRIKLTREGLARRDHFVLATIHQMGIPLCLTLSGGYAKTPEVTADLHAICHRTAKEVYRF